MLYNRVWRHISETELEVVRELVPPPSEEEVERTVKYILYEDDCDNSKVRAQQVRIKAKLASDPNNEYEISETNEPLGTRMKLSDFNSSLGF